MKLIKKICTIIAVFYLFTFVACGEKAAEESIPNETMSLVIIIGKHANANLLPKQDIKEKVQELIAKTITESKSSSGFKAEAHVSVIISDGRPKAVKMNSSNKDLLSCSSNNYSDFVKKKDMLVDNIIDYMLDENMRSDDDEVDLLAAISEAQKILNTDKADKHHIVIIDTGFTTKGRLDMRKPECDITKSEISDIIDYVKKGIPDLAPNGNATQVTFIGLGNVASPQDDLNDTELENKMVDLWTSIIEDEACGQLTEQITYWPSKGENMIFDEDNPDNGYKYVTVLFKKIIIEPPTPPENGEGVTGVEHAFSLTSDVLGFKPDTAIFRDATSANNVFESFKTDLEEYIENTDGKVYVVGSIARVAVDRTQRTDPLAKKRAEAIAKKLVEDYKIPMDRIVTIDAGVTKFSWRNNDEFPNGVRDPLAQQKNRVVEILFEQNSNNETSVYLNELINAGYVDANTHEAINQ